MVFVEKLEFEMHFNFGLVISEDCYCQTLDFLNLVDISM